MCWIYQLAFAIVFVPRMAFFVWEQIKRFSWWRSCQPNSLYLHEIWEIYFFSRVWIESHLFEWFIFYSTERNRILIMQFNRMSNIDFFFFIIRMNGDKWYFSRMKEWLIYTYSRARILLVSTRTCPRLSMSMSVMERPLGFGIFICSRAVLNARSTASYVTQPSPLKKFVTNPAANIKKINKINLIRFKS